MERAGQIFGMASRMRRHVGARLASVVWPPACMTCGADVSDPHGLCTDCWRELRLTGGAQCLRCALPMPEGYGGDGSCEECVGQRFSWGSARAATFYGGASRQLVLSLKHGDRPDLARPMATWMRRAAVDVLARADLAVPVPLHWTRRIKRRMNQSAELARRIAAEQGIDHGPGILLRTRATETQHGKNVEQRHRNVAGAFACRVSERVDGRRIVLIDDVMTTGATLNAAARVLRSSGAVSVDVLVFARVVREENVHF